MQHTVYTVESHRTTCCGRKSNQIAADHDYSKWALTTTLLNMTISAWYMDEDVASDQVHELLDRPLISFDER